MQIDFAWTDQGRASARRNGVPYADAIAVVDGHPQQVGMQSPVGLYLYGPSSVGVICVQTVVLRGTTIHEITAVTRATPYEVAFWEEHHR